MNYLKFYPIPFIFFLSILLFGCNKSAKWTSEAVVTTVSHNTLSVNANYDISGAKNDVEVGICWNDTGNPNLDNGSFTESISSSTSLDFIIDKLYANHVYYIRPFVYREDGTALLYGDEIVTTTSAIPAFDNCTLTTGEVEKSGTVYTLGGMSSYLNSQSFQLSVTTSDFDFTFHFKEEPQSGVYINDASPQYLQDFQFFVSAQVFEGDNCTYYGSVDQEIHVNSENDIITLSFCELEITTSGTCTPTLLLSGELSGS